MNQDQFLLKWNNHQNNLVEVFSFLRTQDAFVDVTLACDGKSFPAHKVVLSACSPYFQSLFQSNPCKHPIVFLKDVKSHDMEALIEFIYKGEVSVSQAELASLISTAENLKIKGLAEPEKPNEKVQQHSSSGCGSKRLASPTRLGCPQPSPLQPTLNSSPGLHAAPMYHLQSTPSAKRKRVEAASHYYTPAYLGTGGGGGICGNGSVLLRDKDDIVVGGGKGGGVVACNSNSGVVVDMNSSAAHRLVETVVNSTGSGGCSGPSQVVLVQGPVPGEEHIATAGELTYNGSSHHGVPLSTSDAVLYSVAGTAIYVGRVGSAPGDEGGAREVMYTTTSAGYASSDEGSSIPASATVQVEDKNEVKLCQQHYHSSSSPGDADRCRGLLLQSIKLEPSANLAGEPWEPPGTNGSNHSYEDAKAAAVAAAAANSSGSLITSSCITSPQHSMPPHPSPIHLQHNHILVAPPHTPTSAASPTPTLAGTPTPVQMTVSSSSGGSGSGGGGELTGDSEPPQSILGLTLHTETIRDGGEHGMQDTTAARAGGGGGGGGGGGVCDEARCLDMTNFAAPGSTQSNNGAAGGGSNCTSTGPGSNNSSNSSTGSAAGEGAILEVQGCFIKSEVGSITSGTMRRLLECEHCHKFFTSRFNLQRHQLIHTGAKPYECPLCQQRFNQSGHVKTHLRTRHPNHDQILQDPIQQQQLQQGHEHRSGGGSGDHGGSIQLHSEDEQQLDKDEEDHGSRSDEQRLNNEHVAAHSIQHSDHVTTHTIQRTDHL